MKINEITESRTEHKGYYDKNGTYYDSKEAYDERKAGKEPTDDTTTSNIAESRYGIWATVSGGSTGTRSAWTKSDGERMEFETYEEAEAVANEYQQRQNKPKMGFGTGASYRYEATPFMGSM